MEVELKLLVDAAGAQALRRHPLLKQFSRTAPHTLALSAIYFDTPDLLLRHSDVGLRVRRNNGIWTQTMKAGGSVAGGLHSRHEWESVVLGATPDLPALRALMAPDSPWAALLDGSELAASLQPIFTMEIRRTVWTLLMPEGDEVECVLDLGRVDCGDEHAPLCEIEFELKSGEPLRLYDLALALQQDIPMRIGTASKAARGYALYANEPRMAIKAEPIILSKSLSVEQAFEQVVTACLTQVLANEDGVADSDDPEVLHQMRIGLRRLKLAFKLFRKVAFLPPALQQELAWLDRQLGPARDWDVLCQSTLPALAVAMAPEPVPETMTRAARKQAVDAHVLAAMSVASPRTTRFFLELGRWMQARSWRTETAPAVRQRQAGPIRPFAHRTLLRALERLCKRGTDLPHASASQAHRARITAKNLRYASEFFASLQPVKASRRYLTALANLQTTLGERNDAVVADRLLHQLGEHGGTLAAGSAFARGYLRGQEADTMAGLGKQWQKFAVLHLPH
ncbi:MAG: CYTH and CHAD domain-containing protein [Herminiimonas sp.]|nr:CYTH and CHAD domain-containing protein [Herminiimonas sp.]